MPFVVAHRAGNDLVRLRGAEELGVDLVEADVRLWWRRLEVRHLKTVGPLPILWDRWQLANPLAPRLQLRDLFAHIRPETGLMLDLKGVESRLAELVLAELPPGRPVTISARNPRLLQPFAGLEHVRRIRSVGSRRGLRALLRRDLAGLDGVAVDERLLDAELVAELHRRTGCVLSWPVNDTGRAAELVALGVEGLISDRPEALMRLPALRPGRADGR
jgi:glycerophosphoryl diester phosphodiesterase